MNKLCEVVIFGASGHAKVTIDILEKSGGFKIIGLLDSNKPAGLDVLGYKVLGGLDYVSTLLKEIHDLKFFIAIGDNWLRYQVFEQLLGAHPQIEFVNAIHPASTIGRNVEMGKGIMVMAGSIVNADTFLGDFTIVNTKSSVGHDSRLQKFSSLAPNTTLGGNVDVGEFSAVSLSASIINGKKVGEHTIIGAGSLLLEDADAFSVYYGIPSKFVRPRERGDNYL